MTATEQVWTLGALLDWTAKHLAQKDAEFPRLDAEVLLAHVVGCKRIDLYGLRHGEIAGPEVRERYRDLIRRRLEGCPVAYLVGRKEFYGMEFAVSPAVLIPRPDTEHVVIDCLGLAKEWTNPRILDIGTGSGNIALTLAKHIGSAQVTAIDASPAALEVARGNAKKHDVEARVRFLEGDLFAPLAADERFDFIVSNPPYIAREDLAALPVGVRQYEPHLALAGGPGGFVAFDRLIDEARRHLQPRGYLIVEIGDPQEAHARAKIESLPEYELAPTIYDYSRHPRVLRARRR
jgi:release factor glutamine methyltransferase